ncbi:unnamed protein product, partial [Clonostachys byssicola]
RGGTGETFRALNGPHHCPGAASTSTLVLRRAGRILAPSESPRMELEFAQLQKDENGGVLRELADLHSFKSAGSRGSSPHTHRLRRAVPGRCEDGKLNERNYTCFLKVNSLKCDDDLDRHCLSGDLPTCMKQTGPPLPCGSFQHPRSTSNGRVHTRGRSSQMRKLSDFRSYESRQVYPKDEPQEKKKAVTNVAHAVTCHQTATPFSTCTRCRVLMTNCGP